MHTQSDPLGPLILRRWSERVTRIAWGDCDDVDYISDDAVCSASAADDRGRTSSR